MAEARAAIESSLAAEDVEKAEKARKTADESLEPGAEFADLRTRVVEVRRAVEGPRGSRADEAIAASREEFTRVPRTPSSGLSSSRHRIRV